MDSTHSFTRRSERKSVSFILKKFFDTTDHKGWPPTPLLPYGHPDHQILVFLRGPYKSLYVPITISGISWPKLHNSFNVRTEGWRKRSATSFPTLVTESQCASFFVPLGWIQSELTMPVGGMAWGWSKHGLHAMPLSLLLPIQKLVNSLQFIICPPPFPKYFCTCPWYTALPSWSLFSPSPLKHICPFPLLCCWPFPGHRVKPAGSPGWVHCPSSQF